MGLLCRIGCGDYMQFVASVRNWWKFWSVQLAMLAGVAAGWLTSDPQILGQMVAYVPDRYRPVASILVGLSVAIIPTVVRMVKQSKLEVKQSAGKQ